MKRLKWVALLALLFPACNVRLLDEAKVQEQIPDMVIGNFSYLSLSDTGQKEWELKGADAKMYSDENEVYINNLAMTMYNESNAATSFLTGDRGYLDQDTLDAVVIGHVKILSDNGLLLEAPKVYWENETRHFYTVSNDLVTMTRGKTIINGYELFADMALEEVTFQNVVGKVYNEE